MYRIKFRMGETRTMTARYGHKTLVKGRTYNVRRKLTPSMKRGLKASGKVLGYRLISVRKI